MGDFSENRRFIHSEKLDFGFIIRLKMKDFFCSGRRANTVMEQQRVGGT